MRVSEQYFQLARLSISRARAARNRNAARTSVEAFVREARSCVRTARTWVWFEQGPFEPWPAVALEHAARCKPYMLQAVT